MRGALDAMDADKDGQATSAEHDAFRRGHFNSFDRDQKGYITLDDYTRFLPAASPSQDR